MKKGQNYEEDVADILKELKNKYFDIIKDKYLTKHLQKSKNSNTEEEFIDNVIKSEGISQKDKLIRNLLVFFDFLFESLNITFKIEELDYFHKLTIRKIIVGALKGINKHKEIHFLCIIFETKITEYIIIDEENKKYNVINMFQNNKIFLNFKFEYGLFPKGIYSISNTININAEINKTKMEISTRMINSIFKLLVNYLLKFFFRIC